MGDVPEAWLTAYDVATGPLREHEPDLAAAVRAWLVDDVGDGRSVLKAVQALAAAPMRFSYSGSLLISSDYLDALPAMLDDLPSLPPPFLGRFVALVHASESPTWQPGPLSAFLRLVSHAYTARRGAGRITFPISFLERLCVAYRLPTSRLLTDAHKSFTRGHHHDAAARLPRFDGFADYVRRHEDKMRELLRTTGVSDRIAAMGLVAPLPDNVLVTYVPELAGLATSGSVKVRAAAEPLLARCGETAVEQVRAVAEAGKPEARMWALRRLWAEGDADQRAWCEERAAVDKAGPVRMLVEEWSSLATAGSATEDVAVERALFDWREVVSDADRALLDGFVVRANSRSSAIDPAVVDQLVAALAAGRPEDLPTAPAGDSCLYWAWHQTDAQPRLGVPATAALLHLCGELVAAYAPTLSHRAGRELVRLYEESGRPTMTELAALLDDLGYDGATVVLRTWAATSDWSVHLQGRPDEEVAEFTALHLETVLAHVATTERMWGLDRRAPHRALSTLPTLPAQAVDHLYAVALGPLKVERRAAQDLLNRVPGMTHRIIPTLGDSRAEMRAEAAAWLGRIADPAALEPLERAFAREKHDRPLAAMLDALQALGQPVEHYLRPDDLADQAGKAIAKGLPKDLDWFPWGRLPEVRWCTGGDVPLEVLQWFLSQAVKGRSPEPNALLRTYASMFEPSGREALGQFVLEAWVAEDTRAISPDVAQQSAEWEAKALVMDFQRDPGHFQTHPLYGRSYEQILEAVLPRHQRTPVGSASASRGVLALAAACAGHRAAPVVQRYLKQFQALRRTQGQALVAMLAWVDHPSATQVLLSVGSRFRSKSIQAEANKQAEALAERRGWSLTELTDRSVPVAGLDDEGELQLSYGDRTFTARLLPDLSLELRSPDDAVIKALPAPRVADDEEAAKEAKKALNATKRELKAVLEHQTARLYEALCTQRTWEYAVWHRYVLGHPVLRHLAQRLVWTIDGALVRPLGDGTLTDVHDTQVKPDDDATVSLAHESLVPGEVTTAWIEHLADYEVTPLFQQFGRGACTLPEELRSKEAIDELEGSILESFALRGRAGKLGYRRGEAGDAATFTTYEKPFASLGLTAVVHFTGNTVPEQNVTVALTELTFERSVQHGPSARVLLGDVPPVLLSEAWNDLRVIAADGSGFDPDWHRKVAY